MNVLQLTHVFLDPKQEKSEILKLKNVEKVFKIFSAEFHIDLGCFRLAGCGDPQWLLFAF